MLVLMDGTPVALDMYGYSATYFTPPAPLMEEIQVIAGGGALIYGPQASAAINYKTPQLKKDMPTSGRLNLSYGSYNLLSSVNSVSGSKGRTSYWLGYYRKQGDGYQKKNADFSADNLMAKTNTFFDNNLILKFGLQGYHSDFGMPGAMTREVGPDLNTWDDDGDNRTATKEFDRLKVSRAQLTVGAEKKLSSSTVLESQLWFTAYKRYSKTQNGVSFGSFPTGAAADTNAIVDRRAYGANGEIRLKHDYELKENKHSLSMGYLSYNNNAPITNQTGAAEDSNSGVTTARTDQDVRVSAVFAENTFNFGKLSVVPGVRYENITMEADKRTTGLQNQETYNVLLGGLGLSYFVTENAQVFANVSQGFKPLSFSNVLEQGSPQTIADDDIKPSFNNFYEIGIRGEQEKIDWDFSAYLIQRQNIVSQTTSGANTILTNGGAAEYRGVETAVTLKKVVDAGSKGEGDLYFNANFQNANFKRGDLKNKTPSYVPSALLKYGVIYRLQDHLRVSLLGTFVNEHYGADDHAANSKIPSYMLYDLLGEYNLSKNWSINGAINNLLDEHYFARIQGGIIPTMGRNAYVGANYKF